MNSLQIEHFLSAAKFLNFSKAAEEQHTTQPSISRQVALLEEELGFPLFERTKRNLRLTPNGIIMAQEFIKRRQELSELIHRLSGSRIDIAGSLSICYLSRMNTDMFVYPPSIEFSKRYPGIEMNMTAGLFSDLRRKLHDGDCDIIYTYDFELPALSDISYKTCYAVTPMVVMSSARPHVNKTSFKLADLKGETFLVVNPSESPGRLNALKRILQEFEITDAKIRTVSNMDSALFAVSSGQGVAILSTGMDCVFDSRFHCVILPKTLRELNVHIVAAWRTDNRNPAIPLYIDLLTNTYAIDVFTSNI